MTKKGVKQNPDFNNDMRWPLILACFLVQSPLLAQTDEVTGQRFPDVPDAWAEAVRYENEYFSAGVLFGALLDYTILDQDQQSIDPVSYTHLRAHETS